MSECIQCSEAEESILTHKEHRADCLGCQSRAIARVYGEYPPDMATQVMSRTWADAKTFQRGRSSYWAWVKRLNEAKEKA